MWQAVEQFKQQYNCTNDDIEIHGNVIVLRRPHPWWKFWS